MTAQAIVNSIQRNTSSKLENTAIFEKSREPQLILPGYTQKYTTSLFEDDIWYLYPGDRKLSQSLITLDFTSIDSKYVCFMKTFVHLCLNRTSGKKRLSFKTAKQYFLTLTVFLNYLEQENVTLEQLSTKTIQDFLLYASDKKTVITHFPSVASRLNTYNLELPIKVPYISLELYKRATPRTQENTTERIPEEITGPLLQWANNYVKIYSSVILESSKEYRVLSNKPKSNSNVQLQKWITERVSKNKGVPRGSGLDATKRGQSAAVGGVIKKDVAFLAGVHPECITKSDMRKLDSIIGFPQGLEASSEIPKMNKSWRPQMNPSDVGLEINMLRAACFIVIAFCTGMRVSEVLNLKRGCCTLTNAGKVQVNGTVFKNSPDRAGKPVTWISVQLTKDAITTLECLHEEELLFSGVDLFTDCTAFTLYTTAAHVKRFVTHVNAIKSEYAVGGTIPTVIDGKEFAVEPKMFRRTLAWYIAAQPYGVVAGVLQYKHLKVETFEGYAGTSESNFRLEVEQAQQTLVEVEIYHKYEQFKAQKKTDESTTELVNQFSAIQKETSDFPGQVVNENKLKFLLVKLASKMRHSLLNDCLFDPVDAICVDDDRAKQPGVFTLPVISTSSDAAEAALEKDRDLYVTLTEKTLMVLDERKNNGSAGV